MPTTVKTGWLKDKNGDKFAPKTLTSQVQTSDGVLLEDKIQADLDEALVSKSDVGHTHTSSQITDVEWMATRTLVESDIVFPETQINLANGSIVSGAAMSIQVGLQYAVHWNGVVYYCTAQSDDGQDFVGNHALFGTGATDTGEPFCIIMLGSALNVYTSETDKNITLKISLMAEGPNKLPDEFLPDSAHQHTHTASQITDVEWMATSDASSATVVLAKKTTSTSSATTQLQTATNRPSFTTGVMYKVEWDDTCYYVTPVVRGTTNCLGNLYLVDNTKPNTGEPFFVQPSGLYTKVTVADYSVAHKIKIVLDTSVKMPARFLPDGLTAKIDGKADKATTLAGYSITDAYTKSDGEALAGRVSAVEQKSVFYVTLTNDMGAYSSDVTYAKITEAYESGNGINCKVIGADDYGASYNFCLPLTQLSNNSFIFEGVFQLPLEVKGVRVTIDATSNNVEFYQIYNDESVRSIANDAAEAVKNDLLNGAGTAYDTLKELGDLIDTNKDALDALEEVAAGKADKAYVDTAVAQKTQVQFITWEADD